MLTNIAMNGHKSVAPISTSIKYPLKGFEVTRFPLKRYQESNEP